VPALFDHLSIPICIMEFQSTQAKWRSGQEMATLSRCLVPTGSLPIRSKTAMQSEPPRKVLPSMDQAQARERLQASARMGCTTLLLLLLTTAQVKFAYSTSHSQPLRRCLSKETAATCSSSRSIRVVTSWRAPVGPISSSGPPGSSPRCGKSRYLRASRLRNWQSARKGAMLLRLAPVGMPYCGTLVLQITLLDPFRLVT
jgi:hypothetical protein